MFQAKMNIKQGKFQPPPNDNLKNWLKRGCVTREAKLNKRLLCAASIINCTGVKHHSLNEVIISC